jgi:hypothetical protein
MRSSRVIKQLNPNAQCQIVLFVQSFSIDSRLLAMKSRHIIPSQLSLALDNGFQFHDSMRRLMTRTAWAMNATLEMSFLHPEKWSPKHSGFRCLPI